MQDLFKLPVEIQIIFVAGYLGYKLTTIGRNLNHRTEDFILQTLVFGSIGRAFAYVVSWISKQVNLTSPAPESEYTGVLFIGGFAISGAVLAAIVWRRFLAKTVRWLMSKLNIYHDDHETSVLRSLINVKARWTYIQLHLTNGTVLESHFSKASDHPIPSNPIIINDDGIALYVTTVHRGVDDFCDSEIGGTAGETTISYVPRSEIKQIDIGWMK